MLLLMGAVDESVPAFIGFMGTTPSLPSWMCFLRAASSMNISEPLNEVQTAVAILTPTLKNLLVTLRSCSSASSFINSNSFTIAFVNRCLQLVTRCHEWPSCLRGSWRACFCSNHCRGWPGKHFLASSHKRHWYRTSTQPRMVVRAFFSISEGGALHTAWSQKTPGYLHVDRLDCLGYEICTLEVPKRALTLNQLYQEK